MSSGSSAQAHARRATRGEAARPPRPRAGSRRWRQAGGFVALAAVTGLLAGCGIDSGGVADYEQADACTVDSALVTEVMGTSAYVVAEGDASALPLDGTAAESKLTYLCRIEAPDAEALVVEIAVSSPETIGERQRAIEAASLVFETPPPAVDPAAGDPGADDAAAEASADGDAAGDTPTPTTGPAGVGGVGAPPTSSPNAVLADWFCGEISLTVRGDAVEQPTPEAIESLVTAFAEAAGCWTTPPANPVG